MSFHNKLECLSPAGLFSLAYPKVEHLKDTQLRRARVLPTNIILGWKGLPETNALAYYENG
jgi:hypothetical protein